MIESNQNPLALPGLHRFLQLGLIMRHHQLVLCQVPDPRRAAWHVHPLHSTGRIASRPRPFLNTTGTIPVQQAINRARARSPPLTPSSRPSLKKIGAQTAYLKIWLLRRQLYPEWVARDTFSNSNTMQFSDREYAMDLPWDYDRWYDLMVQEEEPPRRKVWPDLDPEIIATFPPRIIEIYLPGAFDGWREGIDLKALSTWSYNSLRKEEDFIFSVDEYEEEENDDDWRLYVDHDCQYDDEDEDEDEDEDDDFEFEDSHWIDVDGKFYPSNIVRYRQRRVQQERIIKYKKNLPLS